MVEGCLAENRWKSHRCFSENPKDSWMKSGCISDKNAGNWCVKWIHLRLSGSGTNEDEQTRGTMVDAYPTNITWKMYLSLSMYISTSGHVSKMLISSYLINKNHVHSFLDSGHKESGRLACFKHVLSYGTGIQGAKQRDSRSCKKMVV